MTYPSITCDISEYNVWHIMHLEKQRTALGERDVVALLFVRGACLSHLSLGVTNRTHTHTPTRARNPRVRMSTARPLSYNANVRMQRQLDANAPSPLLFSLSLPPFPSSCLCPHFPLPDGVDRAQK